MVVGVTLVLTPLEEGQLPGWGIVSSGLETPSVAFSLLITFFRATEIVEVLFYTLQGPPGPKEGERSPSLFFPRTLHRGP